jgi:hypothetical protein
MMEKNHKILRKALQHLPEYSPDKELWEKIETSLNAESLDNLIQKLGKTEPPESIWEQIDNKLTIGEKNTKIRLWTKWSVASAAVIVMGVLIVNAVYTKHNHLNSSEELLSNRPSTRWQDDDAVVTQTLTLICEAKPEVCRSLEFRKMKEELEDLDRSKQAVVKQLNKHNTDPELNLKLTKIELQQTEIINQMVASVN